MVCTRSLRGQARCFTVLTCDGHQLASNHVQQSLTKAGTTHAHTYGCSSVPVQAERGNRPDVWRQLQEGIEYEQRFEDEEDEAPSE